MKVIYFYGKVQNSQGEDEPARRDHISIYLMPEVLRGVNSGSLEGHLVLAEEPRVTGDIQWLFPKIILPRSEMESFAKKYIGRFIPYNDKVRH